MRRQVLDVRTMDAAEAGLTAGSATNLIAVDAQRLMDTAGSLHELWGLPLQVYEVTCAHNIGDRIWRFLSDVLFCLFNTLVALLFDIV